jgi:phosphodiesterase/alkaline phosphatase D-like protein
LTITNNGPGPATGVTVTDTLPAGAAYYGASSSQGSCSGTTTVTCSLGTLDSNSTGTVTAATVTIVVLGASAGTLTNTATVSANETDPTPANNTATVSTIVAAATATGPPLTTLFGVAPVVLSTRANHRTATSAKLNGMVNTAGQITRYRFQFGKSKRYGKTSSTSTLAAGSKQVQVVIKITKLKPLTTYHYRVVATNATGTTYGKDKTFKTRRKSLKHPAK